MYCNLKNIRKENNISAKEMSEILGLTTTSAYYKKENESVKFTLDEAKKIADYFKKSIEDIFFEKIVPEEKQNQFEKAV